MAHGARCRGRGRFRRRRPGARRASSAGPAEETLRTWLPSSGASVTSGDRQVPLTVQSADLAWWKVVLSPRGVFLQSDFELGFPRHGFDSSNTAGVRPCKSACASPAGPIVGLMCDGLTSRGNVFAPICRPLLHRKGNVSGRQISELDAGVLDFERRSSTTRRTRGRPRSTDEPHGKRLVCRPAGILRSNRGY